MVVFRVDDDQDASLDEIADMAAEESDGPPPEWLTFKGVALAMPNEDGSTPEGPIVLDEPGRYLLLYFIPVGADPEVIAEAMESGEEPELEGGPPHVAAGMIAELTVEPTEQGEEDMVAPTEVASGTGGLVSDGMPGFVIGIMALGALLIFGGAAVSARCFRLRAPIRRRRAEGDGGPLPGQGHSPRGPFPNRLSGSDGEDRPSGATGRRPDSSRSPRFRPEAFQDLADAREQLAAAVSHVLRTP